MDYMNDTKHREEALKVLESLTTRHLVDGNKIDFSSFYCGYRAALDNLQELKTMKQNEKIGKFNIYDFLDSEILKEIKSGRSTRMFLSGVYNDFENKKLVTTNGNFMVYTDCTEFEECFQNKIVSKDKTIIDGLFPNYKKVIPASSCLHTVDNAIVEKIKIAAAQLGYKTQAQAKKGMNEKRFSILIDNLYISVYVLFMLNKFINTQNNIKIECQDDIDKAWLITGDNASMVFMPLLNPANDKTAKEITLAYFENGSLVYNKFED